VIKTHIKRIIFGCTLGAACGVAYWHFSPRIYESKADVFVNSATPSKANEDLSSLLALAVSQSAVSEESILRSEETFKRALRNVGVRRDDDKLWTAKEESDLYLMYDIEAVNQSRVMTLDVKAYDPQEAADIANEIVVVYNELRKQMSTEAYTSAQASLQEQLASTTGDLSTAEQQLKDFKEKAGIADLSASTSSITGYQATLEQQLDSTEADDASLAREIFESQGKIARLPKTVEMNLSEVKSPVLQKIELEIADYETQRTQALRTYTPTSTRVKELDDVISRTRARYLEAQKEIWEKTSRTFMVEPVRAQLEMQLAQDQIRMASLGSRVRSLRRELGVNSALVRALPAKEQQFAQLTRDRDVIQNKYVQLKAQVEQVRLQSNASFDPAALLYPATADDIPFFPKANKIVPLGMLAGGIIGLLVSFVRESFRTTVRTSEEVTNLFELPVVATVPSLSKSSIRKNLRSLSQPSHVPPESFRFMASAAALTHSGTRRVVFTSSGGGVGCSSAAAEYAVAAAKMGIQTTLIDADLTFGSITKVFKMSEKPGLRDILGQRLLASDGTPMATESAHPCLSILPVGAPDGRKMISDAPSELLEGLLNSLHAEAELIVIDCPPIDVVADTSRFVSIVDEVCLVISSNKTSLQAIANSRSLLERCGAKNVSVILTGATPKEEAFTRYNRYLVGRR
jgi:uncharacterized protein involved in exopolysaccharide biosynthesis/Mrp family chromosome partitioning ATPase